MDFDACRNVEKPNAAQSSFGAERELVRIYRALGDIMRLRMVRLLATREEMGCAELAGELGLSRPTLSHHTRILHDSGLIDVRREGPYRYYRLRRDVLKRFAPEVIADLLADGEQARPDGEQGRLDAQQAR